MSVFDMINQAVQDAAAQAQPSDRWEVTLAPYVMAPKIGGTVAVNGRDAVVDITADDIFDHIDLGFMGMAAARKGIGVDGDNSSLDEVKKRGVEIADLTPAEKQAFAKATRPVFDKWAATIGADLVKKAEATVSKAEGSTERK